jgi:hypothetical protein
MDFQREGWIELGDTADRMHYRFAGEVVWASVLAGIPENQMEERLEAILARSAMLIPAVNAIDNVFACYARDRGLPESLPTHRPKRK